MPAYRYKSKHKVNIKRWAGNRFVQTKTQKLNKSHLVHSSSSSAGATADCNTLGNMDMLGLPVSANQEVADIHQIQDPSQQSSYMANKIKHEDLWHTLSEPMLKATYSLEQPPSNCLLCGVQEVPEMFRCNDCGPQFIVCSKCVEVEHRSRPFHSLEKWENGTWLRSDHPSLPVLVREGHECNTKVIEKLIVFNQEGRAVDVFGTFCQCEPRPVTVTRWRLWPVQARNPTICCTFELLEWQRYMLLECHVSQQGFIEAVAWKNALTHEKKCKLKGILSSESLYEYRHMQYSRETLVPDFDDGTRCPACPKGNDASKTILSLDANFGLVKKKSSGTSRHDSKHGSRLFMDEEDVSHFLGECQDDAGKKNAGDCSSFKAGDKVRSKSKSSKLDVTGVFGAVCRHEVPQLFLNLRHGERLVYPTMLLKTWFDRHPDVAQANVFYDIACVFLKYLEKNEKPLLDKINLAIPVFHCYGHKALCQVTYSPRRVSGFGRTDGEAMERLWSYARPFNTISKEMTAAHRQDLLTDAFLHYARKKKTNLVSNLRKRYESAQKEASSCQEQLKEMENQFPVSEEILQEWQTRERNLLAQAEDAKKKSEKPKCWQEEYVVHLQKLTVLRSQIVLSTDSPDSDLIDEITELEAKVSAMENKQGIMIRWKAEDSMFHQHLEAIQLRHKERLLRQMLLHARERSFLSSLKRKYPGGQMMANRISKQISLASKKIQKLTKMYNGANFSTGTIPDTLNAVDVMTPTSPVYSHISNVQENNPIPAAAPGSIIRETFDIHQRLERTLEEKTMLKEEMERLLTTYKHQMDFVRHTMEEEEDSGKLALQTKMLIGLVKAKSIAEKEFQSVSDNCPNLEGNSESILTGTLVPASDEEIELLESYLFQDSSDESSEES